MFSSGDGELLLVAELPRSGPRELEVVASGTRGQPEDAIFVSKWLLLWPQSSSSGPVLNLMEKQGFTGGGQGGGTKFLATNFSRLEFVSIKLPQDNMPTCDRHKFLKRLLGNVKFIHGISTLVFFWLRLVPSRNSDIGPLTRPASKVQISSLAPFIWSFRIPPCGKANVGDASTDLPMHRIERDWTFADTWIKRTWCVKILSTNYSSDSNYLYMKSWG